MSPLGRAWRVLAPLPAIFLGAAVTSAPPVALAPSLVAWAVGAAAFLVATRGEARPAAWPAWAAVALLALTLVAPGDDGVHRWLAVGLMRLNVSAAVLPWIVVVLATAEGAARGRALVVACAAQAIHVAQPDAAQATALACAALPLVLAREARATAGVAALLALAAVAWTRRDPLPPVDHVERVLAIAWARGPRWTAACGAAALALFAPAAAAGNQLGAAAALYLLAALVATFFGHFPVPVLGAGAGPILGWFALTLGLARGSASVR
jgi:hypothetical protein